MDQITLISSDDIESLPYHIRFTACNLPFIARTLYVIPNDMTVRDRVRSIIEDRTRAERSRIVVIDEESIVPSSVCENKWIYQQLVKLAISTLRESHRLSEPFLFTDIDTICVRRVAEGDLIREGKYVFWIAHYGHEPAYFDTTFKRTTTLKRLPAIDGNTASWLMSFSWCAQALLGLKELPAVSAVNACVLWSSTVLTGLRYMVEKRFGKPFNECVLDSFRAFIKEHNDHFYEYKGYRRIVMSYYGGEGLVKGDYDDEYYFRNVRLGFSEWQLYTLFLSMLQRHPYVFHFQPPHTNEFIAEFNAEVQNIEILQAAIASAEQGGRRCHFINFYP
ncbi:MAG: hypothetical protein JW938_05430, partial [Candidatus Omnitrophica bacterium]|nr:hypothetical protein [Candidatus Omnitrophota bacterium]